MMRHLHFPSAKLLFAVSLSFVRGAPLIPLAIEEARAAPVYLRIDSRFPSGHYTRQLLENRTRKSQVQRWFRVETQDKAYGWLPEDHILNALKLANEATLNETIPLRWERSMDAVGKDVVTKGALVTLIDIRGSWAQVRARLKGGQLRDAWVPTESLKPLIPPSPRIGQQKVFIPRPTKLYAQPRRQSRVRAKLRAATLATVTLESQHAAAEWLEVGSSEGVGFVLLKEVVTATDLGANGARPLQELAPLRSAPFPYANLNRNLPSTVRLKVIGTQKLRWGMAKLAEAGEVWWPIPDAGVDADREPVVHEEISTSDLFRRKIFDMASSPAIPKLKFVSAQGVYRTIDGNEWRKIPLFQDKNYPIAIAGLGSVFVGPYVSDDHGETFQQWIRWDSLVATIKHHTRRSSRHLRIEEIRPEDPAGRRVVLKLSVDTDALIRLVTDDQGLSWRPL